MNENKTLVSGGIGFCGLLTIVLIALKLTNFIDISWFWVFMPLFIPFILCVVILIIIVVVNAILKHKMNK